MRTHSKGSFWTRGVQAPPLIVVVWVSTVQNNVDAFILMHEKQNVGHYL